MRHTRLATLLVATLVLGLALMGCGLVSPAVRLLTGPTATPLPRVIEKVVVVTSTPQPRTSAPTQAAPTQTAPAAPAPSITIASGADVESQILRAVYEKVNPSVVYIETLFLRKNARGDSVLLVTSLIA
jgi:hypothetical protein